MRTLRDAIHELQGVDLSSEPITKNQTVNLLNHSLKSVPPKLTTTDLVWECQDCDARATVLAELPLECNDV